MCASMFYGSHITDRGPCCSGSGIFFEPKARSSNSPGTKQNHNYLAINALEIQCLPGGIDLVSPDKSYISIVMIIRQLQLHGLPGLHEKASEA